MQYEDLAGKVALVTGGGFGIGREAAFAYADNGAKIAVVDINEEAANAVVVDVNRMGGEAIAIKADVTRDDDVKKMVKTVIAYFGCLDIAFNNAGIDLEHRLLDQIELGAFESIMDVNVKGVYLSMKYEVEQMLKQGRGVVVNTASVGGLIGAPTMSIYGAAKHAVVGMTKSAAIEYASKGIRVNSVCPGVINTEMTSRALDNKPNRKQQVIQKHPIGRLGEVEEVAAAVMFLSSAASSFVVGHQLVVDGGVTA